MHCALQRTLRYNQNDAVGEVGLLSPKSLSLKECEGSSIVRRNSDHRCALLTVLAREPNGNWRIVGLPLQCYERKINLGSRSRLNMDHVHLASPPLFSSLKGDQQKAQRGPITDKSHSHKLLAAKSASGSNFQNPLQNESFANKEEKAVKRNSRKKARKKGKGNKKHSGKTCSGELERACGNSSSDIATSKDIYHGVELLQHANVSTVSTPEHDCNGSNFEGKNNGCLRCYSKTSFPSIDVSEQFEPPARGKISEDHVLNTENGTQIIDPEYSGVQYRHLKPINCVRNPHSNVICETSDSLALDSASLGSNSDESSGCDYDCNLSNKETIGNGLSGTADCIDREVCHSHCNMLNNVANVDTHGDRTDLVVQDCIGERNMLGKKNKQIRRPSRNSCFYGSSSVANMNGRFLKENNHSVWQKVQRNEAVAGNSELKKENSVFSHIDVELNEASLPEKLCNDGDSYTLSKYEIKSSTKTKVPRKLKRKASMGSRQEHLSCSRQGHHAIKAHPNVFTKINMQEKEFLDIPSKLSGLNELDYISTSPSMTGCSNTELQTRRAYSTACGPGQSQQICSSELGVGECVYDMVTGLNSQDADNEISSLSRSCDSVDQSELLEEPSVVHHQSLTDEEEVKVHEEIPCADHNKKDKGPISALQKWIPVGVKDSGLPGSSQPSSLLIGGLDETVAGSWISKITTEEKLPSDVCHLVSSMNVGVVCMDQNSEHSDVHLVEEPLIQELNYQGTFTPEQNCHNHVATKDSYHKSKQQNVLVVENDPIKRIWAVQDAYMAQMASEAIEMATGSPIAEFERLLYAASPVIWSSRSLLSCASSSTDQRVGASLCRHATQDLSLKSLWQWYEKHGNYGLEVRAEDHESSKRLGIDRFAFRAYFVPFLSAIQLFRESKTNSANVSAGIPNSLIMDPCEIHNASKWSSNISHLPIFSLLVPHPRTEDTSHLSPRNHVCTSKLLSERSSDRSIDKLIDHAHFDDLELLFEYFEVEQPQQRQPLFEMIKQLVRGDGSSQSRVYGDPSILDSVDLRHLHPISWYSVAWYPIYRIPDGNFRAAFLTYHSLGHLVHRGSSSDSPFMDSCVVSPVVGLQSYNAQGECWFQSKHPALGQTEQMLNLNQSEILRERLMTLEQAASLMARGTVSKGGRQCVNIQPDYEFFLSRRR